MKRSFGVLLAIVFISAVLILALPSSIASSAAARGGTIRKTAAAQKPTSESDSTVIGSGEVRPTRYVQVRSAVPGRVEKVYVEWGEDVSRGQALFLIASESTSRARVTRYSPLTGVVAEIPVRTGELTTGEKSSSPVMTIGDMSRISVDVYLDRPDFSRVIVGQPARIVVDAFHEARIIGRVVSKHSTPVALSDVPADAQFRVRLQIAEVPNYVRRRIRPGMSATASIHVAPPKSSCKRQPVEDLVNAFAESFSNKTMGTLDADRPYVGRFTIRIEHSLADDDDPQRFEVRRFSSFARAEQWFKSREVDGLPGRYTREVEKCARGVCSYNTEGGINHRSLYLTKITYGLRNSCPYIKTIYILDGD